MVIKMKFFIRRTVYFVAILIVLEGLVTTLQAEDVNGKKDVTQVNQIEVKSGNSSATSDSSKKAKNVTKTKVTTERTLVIPDRSPEGINLEDMKDESLQAEENDNGSSPRPGQGNFDNKAVQRGLIVIAGIALIIVAYLGVKFFLIKKRKVVKRYGRIEASEMDLLEEIENDEESEDEEEELFDINKQRRS